MATIKFCLRLSQKGRDFPGSLIIRVVHQRKSGSVTTPYKLLSGEWDEKNEKVIINTDDAGRVKELVEISESIQNDKSFMENGIRKLNKTGNFDCKDILDYYRKKNKSKMLYEYTMKLNKYLISAGKERTARAYRSAANALIHFNEGENIYIENISGNMLKKFEEKMKFSGKSLNTISFYMRNIRSIYNKAIKENIINHPYENPFAEVYTGVHITKKRALPRQDIVKLKDLENKLWDYSSDDGIKLRKGLRDSLALFLFSFHSRGMSFVDMAYLRKSNIRDGILIYYRKKTGHMIEMKLNESMKEIIKYFSSETRDSIYVFPIIDPSKGNERMQYESGLRLQNQRLRTLSKIAGIDGSVTTHVARHSWATIAKQENLPLWIISEGLGHSNEKTTYIYLKSFDRSVLDKANDKICSAIRKTI